MRLWEMKKLFDPIINDSCQIVVSGEGIYNNQAYIIHNYSELIKALVLLSEQSWNDHDFSIIQRIIDEYGTEEDIVEIKAQEFNELNAYISSINWKFTLYYSILESMIENQDEHVINVKIPEEHLSSLKDLTAFNNRLDKILLKFNVDWQFEFKWVDVWSSWYVLAVLWVWSYRVFLACLKIAQEFFKTKEWYYKSKKAELDYKAWLSNVDEYNKEWLTSYIDKRLSLEIDEKITNALQILKLKTSKTEAEQKNQIIMATKELIKELWHWTEFHLSLNPPAYVSENDSGSLTINYKKISALIEQEQAPKKLEIKVDPSQEKAS